MKEKLDTGNFVVQFNFDTGELTVVLPDGSHYLYATAEGLRLAQRLDRLIDKAIKQWYKDDKAKTRLKDMH